MRIEKTPFDGLLLLEPEIFRDSRGFFFEAFNEKVFTELGIDVSFVQDNVSLSVKHVIRGLHFQRPPYGQAKLVSVAIGSILDVVVDLRSGSPNYGKKFSTELSAANCRQLFIPRGFAHGFSVQSDEAKVQYKIDQSFHPESEGGIRFDDPDLSIDWRVDKVRAIVSAKDLSLPLFRECKSLPLE